MAKTTLGHQNFKADFRKNRYFFNFKRQYFPFILHHCHTPSGLMVICLDYSLKPPILGSSNLIPANAVGNLIHQALLSLYLSYKPYTLNHRPLVSAFPSLREGYRGFLRPTHLPIRLCGSQFQIPQLHFPIFDSSIFINC